MTGPHDVVSGSRAVMPIAVVGIACSLPGAANPEAFWEMLVAGRSVVGEIPDGRRDSAHRTGDVAIGAFLEDVAGFD